MNEYTMATFYQIERPLEGRGGVGAMMKGRAMGWIYYSPLQ